MTKDEAIDVLTQCKLLTESVDALVKKAHEVLNQPELRLVKDDNGKRPDNTRRD